MVRFVLYLVLTFLDAPAFAQMAPSEITSIYWSDGDSGMINGHIKFRLNSVDAPETGGVGAAIGGAKCELERERGYEAKEWVVELTRNADLEVSNEYGADRYGRLIVDLTVDAQDLGKIGVQAGHLKKWRHNGSKALERRPEWCSIEIEQ